MNNKQDKTRVTLEISASSWADVNKVQLMDYLQAKGVPVTAIEDDVERLQDYKHDKGQHSKR